MAHVSATDRKLKFTNRVDPIARLASVNFLPILNAEPGIELAEKSVVLAASESKATAL